MRIAGVSGHGGRRQKDRVGWSKFREESLRQPPTNPMGDLQEEQSAAVEVEEKKDDGTGEEKRWEGRDERRGERRGVIWNGISAIRSLEE